MIKFSGTLNQSNIEQVAQLLRDLLYGKEFSIRSHMYMDSSDPKDEYLGICRFVGNPLWSDKDPEHIKVFHGKFIRSSISFCAGHFQWSIDAAYEGRTDHEDYYYAVVEIGNDYFKFTERAPQGVSCLHSHDFRVLSDINPKKWKEGQEVRQYDREEIRVEDLATGQIWVRKSLVKDFDTERLKIVGFQISADVSWVTFRVFEKALNDWSQPKRTTLFEMLKSLNFHSAKLEKAEP